MTRVVRLRVLLVAGVFAVGVGTAVSARVVQGNLKSVNVLVVDPKTNKAVLGVPTTAFAIREDNVDREVVKAEPSTEPMAVVFLVDTTSAFVPFPRDLRESSAAFVKKFLTDSPKSSVAMWEFGGADIPIVDFTSDATKLADATAKIFPKGTLSETDFTGSAVLRGQNITASNLLEAYVDAAKVLGKRPEQRRFIVSFNHDISVEASKVEGGQIQQEVQKAGATLVAVSLLSRVNNGPKRDDVLDKLPSYSGGLRITINGVQSLASTLENVADILAKEYVVTYARPSGTPKTVLVGLRVAEGGPRAYTARWAPK
jgi:hypothetical protein